MNVDDIAPGGCAISSGQCLLKSDGHFVCYNIVIFNELTRDAMMVHVNPGLFYQESSPQENHLNGYQRKQLEDFVGLEGKKTAVIVVGDESKSCAGSAQYIESLNVPVLNIIHVKSSNYWWNVAFSPCDQRLSIEMGNSTGQQQGALNGRGLYSGSPFSEQERHGFWGRPIDILSLELPESELSPLLQSGALKKPLNLCVGSCLNLFVKKTISENRSIPAPSQYAEYCLPDIHPRHG